MNTMQLILFLGGMLLGGGVIFLFLRSHTKAACENVRTRGEMDMISLQERLKQKETTLIFLQDQLATLRNEISQAQERILIESQNRAAAEQQAQWVSRLTVELHDKERQVDVYQKENTELKTNIAELQGTVSKERELANKQLEMLEASKIKMLDAFKALSAETLRDNNQSFMVLAQQTFQQLTDHAKVDMEKRQTAVETLVRPVQETLEKFDVKMQDLEKSRIEAYAGLSQQVRSLIETQGQLKTETAQLVKALSSPKVRGKWGEMQLRRVVEMAGMIEHCDFLEQKSVEGEEGKLRPDLIIRLPGNKCLAVDAKAVIDAYFEASQTTDENIRQAKLKEHARHLRGRVTELSRKAYWDQFTESPDFVVLFLPGESFFSAALESDPDLIEQSVSQRVIIATPTTLIALLKAVAYGWNQAALAVNAQVIRDLGQEIFKRLADLTEHFQDLGLRLDGAVSSYNRAIGTLESRVLVSARRFKELKVPQTEKDLELIPPLSQQTRMMQSLELITPNIQEQI